MIDIHKKPNAPEPDGNCIYPQLCTFCAEFTKHQAAAGCTRREYKKDVERIQCSDEKTVNISVDMQKVVMLLRIPGYK